MKRNLNWSVVLLTLATSALPSAKARANDETASHEAPVAVVHDVAPVASAAPVTDAGAPPPQVVTLMTQGFDPDKLAPCAVLDDFGGRVQVMSPSRERLLDTDVRAGVPCGGWVTVEDGWARLIHRDGYQITVGANTFIEIFGSETKDQFRSLASDGGGNDPGVKKDQIVLYKGQIKVHAGAGAATGEIRILSPHARVRLKKGRIVVLFNKEANETQLIALEQSASLENRFEADKRVTVREGEASSLNFRAMRVVPSIPQAISIAALHQKMGELKIDERTQTEAITAARIRQNRKFASDLGKGRSLASERKPAGLVFEKERYMKHPPRPEDEKVRRQWTKRLVGGESDGEQILNPDEFYGQGKKISVTVYDPSEGHTGSAQQESRAMKQEKERLMKELGRLQAD